jgi:predicted phosphodiesterase
MTPIRVAVITDTHGNLPALRTALEAIGRTGCDAIFHTGDAIGIGPAPAECVELLLSTRHTHCLLGNHEGWLLNGLPDPPPVWMSGWIAEHLEWTWDQIRPPLRSAIAGWPHVTNRRVAGLAATFLHYARDSSGKEFLRTPDEPTAHDMELIFGSRRGGIVFFGHDHLRRDIRGRTRYVNPGALGCHEDAVARYCLADFAGGRCRVRFRGAEYSDDELRRLFEERKVPQRRRIYTTFFPERLAG